MSAAALAAGLYACGFARAIAGVMLTSEKAGQAVNWLVLLFIGAVWPLFALGALAVAIRGRWK